MLLLIAIAFIILGDFILRTLLWFGFGKIFKINDVTLKKAFQSCLLFMAFYITLSIILNFVFDITLGRQIITITSILFGIYILKVVFKTTNLKSMAIYFPSLIIIGCLALFIRINIVQAYKNPSAGNKPTLVNGDRILANKYVYDYSEPRRGDLIVFPLPGNPNEDLVKRIIGIEGDKIEIINDDLYLNDKQVPLKKLGKYQDGIIEYADEYIETLGVRNYHILDEYQRSEQFGPVIVPESSYFVLGDNRDNSKDSRHYGFIDKGSVKGKAEIIYWSNNPNNFDIRWERIGKAL